MNTVTIIGGGLGNELLLTGEAKDAIARADRIYTTPRLAQQLAHLNPRIQGLSTQELLSALEEEKDACAIVSGDVGFHSLSRTLERKFGQKRRIRRINGLGSLPYFCGRLGIEYDDCVVASTHGKRLSLLGYVAYNQKVLALTSGPEDTKAILAELRQAGLGEVQAAIGQNLGSGQEQIFRGTSAFLEGVPLEGLMVLFVENPHAVDTAKRLRDEEFIRGKVPMTKEAVRALSLYQLEVGEEDVVYDIGSGTGSVSVALAYQAKRGIVYSIEQKEEAIALLEQNIRKLGAYNIKPVLGKAPGALEGLPPPSKVFMGGSGGEMANILAFLSEKYKCFTVCGNVITIENIARLLETMESLGFQDIDAQCVNISVAKKAGAYHMMNAQNPVYIASGRWEVV